mmetsp:Transcript_42557/g.69175  ORF Transcript_42557/g.69175 Transcript_42557/m.69175 type:complete len:122 (+) Transcript_42557:41-406(+)
MMTTAEYIMRRETTLYSSARVGCSSLRTPSLSKLFLNIDDGLFHHDPCAPRSSNSLFEELAEMIIEASKVAVVVLHCFCKNVLMVRRDEASHCFVPQVSMLWLTLRVNLEKFPLDLAALIG